MTHPPVVDVALPAMDLERQALEQIKTVCVDNAALSCKHRMALDFVRQIASDCLAAQTPAAFNTGEVK